MMAYISYTRKISLLIMLAAWMTLLIIVFGCQKEKPINPVKKETFIDRGDTPAEMYFHKQDVDQVADYIYQKNKREDNIVITFNGLLLALLGFVGETCRRLFNEVKRLAVSVGKIEVREGDFKNECDTNHDKVEGRFNRIDERVTYLERKKT